MLPRPPSCSNPLGPDLHSVSLSPPSYLSVRLLSQICVFPPVKLLGFALRSQTRKITSVWLEGHTHTLFRSKQQTGRSGRTLGVIIGLPCRADSHVVWQIIYSVNLWKHIVHVGTCVSCCIGLHTFGRNKNQLPRCNWKALQCCVGFSVSHIEAATYTTINATRAC